MSVIFLDELLLFRVDMSLARQTESSNVSLVKLSNIHERSTTIPGPVGTLPLDYFIYIIIGAIVFLCCSFSIWAIFKAMISPRKYFETMGTEASAGIAPPYREKRVPAPERMNTITRREVENYRSQERYQADGFLEPSLAAKPNLPLPVVREIADPEEPRTGTNAGDIEAWGNLVKEKERLNITIANLERLPRQAGQLGAINPRLHAALQRRADVENSINATYERFRERRGEWSTEEWQVVELIMQYSPR